MSRKMKKRRRCEHPCECGWRVRWTAKARLKAQELGIWDSVKYELKDLEKRLRNPETRDKTLADLLSRKPLISFYIKKLRKWFPARKYYFGRQTARGFYVILPEICRVWFVYVGPRTDSTYKSKRKRV